MLCKYRYIDLISTANSACSNDLLNYWNDGVKTWLFILSIMLLLFMQDKCLIEKLQENFLNNGDVLDGHVLVIFDCFSLKSSGILAICCPFSAL